MIEIKGVNKTYKSKKSVNTNALKDINLKFENKGLVFIVGKSGSGKTTLLNMLGGLDSPEAGKILVDNKDLCKMNQEELDYYRNSYLGFVFQDYNLLEEFNVFENINISLKLQNIDNKQLILDTLKMVDLEGLEKRNINELSGGQKQRVSIARSLVKKPKLILADEPTGNLDSKSSNQVFKILKNISKDALVIVVSHDIESAFVYADRIIKLEDGEVIEDSKKNVKRNKLEKGKLIKSILPFSYSYKMAKTYLLHKPQRLILTILLSLVAFSFMCFCINVYLFNDISLISNTIKDNNSYVLKIDYKKVKLNQYGSREEESLDFNDDSIDYVEYAINGKVNMGYLLYEDNNLLGFEFGSLSEKLIENDAYNMRPNSFIFINTIDDRIINSYIGSYPKKNNEIIVHKYFADSMINYGIYDINGNLYKPKNYEEIINSKTKIRFGKHYAIITGIVDDDNSLYKQVFNSGEFWNNEIKRHYIENYSSKSSLIYVNNKFIKNLELNNDFDSSKVEFYNDGQTSSDRIEVLNSKIKYYDLNGNLKEIKNLSNNDVILSIDTFRLFSDYNKNFDNYLKKNRSLVYNKIVENYLIKYLKENKSNLKIKLINRTFNNIDSVNVIGVSLGEKNYIGSYLVNNYTLSKKVIKSLFVYEDNTNNIKNIFNDLDYTYDKQYYDEGEKYYLSFNNSSNVYSVIFIYHMIKRYLFTFSVIFVLFSILLILNYISASITNFKKEIGILKSIGTSSRDVTKIFVVETLLIGIISWIFGIIMWLVESYELSSSLFKRFYFTLNGIVINPSVLIISFVFIVLSSLLITCLLMEKINRIRPIDVILNKN